MTKSKRPNATEPHGLKQQLEKSGAMYILKESLLNKGTAFSTEERDEFSLHGLLPPHQETLDEQIKRARDAIDETDDDLTKYLRLRALQDDNEVLFYALLQQNLQGLLPIIYTPTVGAGCEEFSLHFQHPRGLFISYPQRDRIAQMLAHPRFDAVEVIVVSDGERILGLGDQGANGMGIPIGKLSLYVGCGGFDPARTLPILLDTGTDSLVRRNDPRYVGWRHERIRGKEYDAFIEDFVTAVEARWPHVLLQWEDFAQINAQRLLDRYRDRLCTFNDDIQGTAAVVAGTILAAARAINTRLSDHTIVLFGAGSAGSGIARLLLRLMQDEGLAEAEARGRFYAIDKNGLLLEDMGSLQDFNRMFARKRHEIADWSNTGGDNIDLPTVLNNIKATVLLGASGQKDAFDKKVIETMADKVDRPIVLPLSNPTSKAEATPKNILEWSQERALIGTGSPFPEVEVAGKSYPVDQTNNSYIFPGFGLGLVAVGARRATDTLFLAASKRLAELVEVSVDGPGRMLPPVSDLQEVAMKIAQTVAKTARDEKLCDLMDDEEIDRRIRAHMWQPNYQTRNADKAHN